MADEKEDYRSLVYTAEDAELPDEMDSAKFSFTNFSKQFDDHIDKSIRGYSTLRRDVVSISKYFVEDDTTVLDLGCSQGSLLRAMFELNTHVTNTQYLGVDVNESFQQHWVEEERLKYRIDDPTTWRRRIIRFCSHLRSFVTTMRPKSSSKLYPHSVP